MMKFSNHFTFIDLSCLHCYIFIAWCKSFGTQAASTIDTLDCQFNHTYVWKTAIISRSSIHVEVAKQHGVALEILMISLKLLVFPDRIEFSNYIARVLWSCQGRTLVAVSSGANMDFETWKHGIQIQSSNLPHFIDFKINPLYSQNSSDCLTFLLDWVQLALALLWTTFLQCSGSASLRFGTCGYLRDAHRNWTVEVIEVWSEPKWSKLRFTGHVVATFVYCEKDDGTSLELPWTIAGIWTYT